MAMLSAHWPRAIAYVWLPLLYVAALIPTPSFTRPGPEPFTVCVLCGDRGSADFILNVAMFVPFGLLAARRLGVGRTFMLGVALSTGIEVVQLFLPGRFSTLGDILANGSGAALGAWLYSGLLGIARGAGPRRWVAPAFGLLAGAVTMVGAWLIQPAPTNAEYWGQWTPNHRSRYAGTVLEARFNGRPFPSTRLPGSWHAREDMLTDWTLSSTVIKGEPPRSGAAILAIFDGEREEILYLGAMDEHLFLRERLRAQDLRLDRPELVFWNALAPVDVGATMQIVARRDGSERCIAVNSHEECGLGFTPGRFWSLLLFAASAPNWLRRAADAAWLAVLFLPIGLFARSWRSSLVGAGLAVTLIAASIAMTRLGPDPFLEPLGAAVGLAIGLSVHRCIAWWGRVTHPDPPTPPCAPESDGST